MVMLRLTLLSIWQSKHGGSSRSATRGMRAEIRASVTEASDANAHMHMTRHAKPMQDMHHATCCSRA